MKKLLSLLVCALAYWASPCSLQADTGSAGKKLGASLIWEKLITDASQFSSNSMSVEDGSSYANLIDDNKESVFHSVWNATMASSSTTVESWLQTLSGVSGGINSDAGYHNLQVALNKPVNSFKFMYYGRNSDWHDNPNHIVIYATNDDGLAASTSSTESEQWTQIAELTAENANFPGDVYVIDSPYESPQIELGDSYKYIRFEIRGTTHQNKVDSRMFAVPDITGVTWNVSEFQMYAPVEVESSMFIDSETLFVKDAASISVGNLASGEAGNLIDNNTETTVATKAGESEDSYIQATRPFGFSQSVAIAWTEGNASDKITQVSVLVSNNGTAWDKIGDYTPQDMENGAPAARGIIADLGDKYKYVRIVPTATESTPAPEGSLALNIAEFNISPAAEILDLPLQTLVDSYPLGVEDYEYGTDPGFVGDEAIYNEFYNTYTDALITLGSSSATDEQKLEISRKLQKSKALVEARIVVPETGKYYYIQSANKVFSDNEKVVDWFAPRQGLQPGWHVKQKKLNEAWTIEMQPSGYYAIKNAATGSYVSHTMSIDANNSPLVMSNSLETAQELININYTGQFNIRASVASRYYNSQEANNGAADDGPIASWTDKSLGGEGSWYILEIPSEELAAMLTTANHDRLEALANSFVDIYEVGMDPGQYGKTVYEAAIAELAKAKEMLADESSEYTEEQYGTAYDALKAAIDALENGRNEVETGYYTITDKKWSEISSVGGNTPAWSTVTESDFLQAAPFEAGNPAFIWKVTKLPSGNYTMQNVVDGRYIDNTSLLQEGAAIAVAASSNVEQTINWFDGRYEISNTGAKNFLYQSTRNNTKRESVYIVKSEHHVTWCIHRYTDAEADSIIKAYPQRLLTEELEGLVKEARNKANSTVEYELDLNSPIVTNASQFYCNNLSTEGSLENLIDNNFDSHFISAYNASAHTSENAYHYLRVDAGEGKTLPEKFGMHWRTRGSVWSNMYRPVDVIYSVSDDAENWIDLGEDANPTAGFPVTAEVPEFTSKTAIAPGKGYRYFKLTVLKTNTQDLGLHGYPFFTFSEFNLYPTGEAKETSMINDPEVKTAVDAVEAAIAAAQQKIDANSVTSQDVTDFRNVYNELLLVFKDTSDLYNVYVSAAKYYEGVSIGEDYELFTFPEDKVLAFEEAFFAVEEARPFTEISQRRVAELDTALTRAYSELRASMHNIDVNKWYNILSADETTTTSDGTPVSGQGAYIGGLSSVDGTGLTGASLEDLGTRAAWKFSATETPGQYYIYNCWSGWRMDNGNLFELVPLGDGQVALKRVYDNGYYNVIKSVLPGVPIQNITPQVGGSAAWTIEEASEVLLDKYTCYQGEITSAVLPYESYRPYVRENFTTLKAYKVSGYQTSADGKEITAINLTEYADNENIPAATPFIFTVPYPEEEFDANTFVKVSMEPIVHSEVTQEMKPANGLIGTFSTIALSEGMIQFDSGDSAFVKSEGYSLSPRCVYLDVSQIVNDPDAKVDKVVYIAGRAGLINGIKDVMLDAGKPVNVYTADGVLIRRNVMPAEATKGLARGIYIVGKDKVMVK